MDTESKGSDSRRSAFSNRSANTKKPGVFLDKINLNQCFTHNNKFKEFLNSYEETKSLLYLVDDHSNIWELLKRNDLKVSSLRKEMEKSIHNKSMISITSNDIDISKASDLTNFNKNNDRDDEEEDNLSDLGDMKLRFCN